MSMVAQCMRILPLALIGAGCLLLAAQEMPAAANKAAFARECALRDVGALIWVEEQADAQTMPSALLAEAAFTVLRARHACLNGKVAEAIALYDSVLTSAAGAAISADAGGKR